MADEILSRDQNRIVVLGGITDNVAQEIRMLRVDPITKRLLVTATGAGSGTVTSISSGTGILLTPDPITTTGSVALVARLQPMATLTGNALKVLRVNAGETAVEYATISSGGLTIGTTIITSGTTTRILYDNAGVLDEYPLSGATSVVMRDTNTNSSSNNFIDGYTTTVTAAGTTTLTVASTRIQFFTGSSNQTVTLPVTSTMVLGQVFYINNLSTGLITVNSSGGNTIYILAPGVASEFTVILTSGTSATSWDSTSRSARASSGKIFTSSNTLTLAGTDATIMTFPTTSATIARTDAGQTFTGVQIMTSPKILTDISDTNGNEEVKFVATASAVNEITITNAATGTAGPIIAASGETNVDLQIAAKGTGKVHHTNGIYGDNTADVDGATITFNMATSNIHSVTLGGNRTLALSNVATGQCFILRLQQDTSTRTVTWFTTIKWAGGVAPVLTLGATNNNKADMFGFVCTTAGNYDGFIIGQNI